MKFWTYLERNAFDVIFIIVVLGVFVVSPIAWSCRESEVRVVPEASQ